MLKQFNVEQQVFADPGIYTKDGKPILDVTKIDELDGLQLKTSGEGWYAVDTQADIDGISASITGGGEVWVDNGKLRYSGKCPSDNHKWDSQVKKWVKLTKAETQEKLTALLTQQRENVLNELANKADELKSSLLAGYPQTEIDSFYRQEKEALAWQADNSIETPMLTQIAKIRGVPFGVLVQKVLEKSNQFAIAIGAIIGKRQAFEDRLLAVKTPEELTTLEEEISQWQITN